MEKKNMLRKRGKVVKNLPGSTFKVELDEGGETLAYVGGEAKRRRLTIVPGDQVLVEMHPSDITRGRIIGRL